METHIVTRSPCMRQLLDQAEKFAASGATILVTGESGTGKELLARFIHKASPMRAGALLAVNSAAFSETVVESELFGHEAGAFTGAIAQRKGRFEQAAGGSIFLDEFGELTLPMQAKLLRVLEEGEFQRVGGSTTQRLQARVIVATNKDLQEEVASGRFREDLLYRINPLELHAPPLRQRMDDLPLLVEHFLAQFQSQGIATAKTVQPAAMNRLLDYHWPGNVRELRNVLLRAAVLAGEQPIEHVQFPAEPPRILPFAPRVARELAALPLSEIERLTIMERLEHCDGNQTRAAATLGITSRTLRNKLAEYRKLSATG
ncbi:MAG: sigma-54-dependent Fis family transcriptional regulator [Planctomycetaceae bacterium]|nr:sigma-54-dependent Fis family transcriptional regulator [Planctomycetaceae bacterium]